MRFALLIPLLAAAITPNSFAQASTPTWRCGNVYTNIAADTQAKNCKLVEGGNVTVISGPRPNGGVKVATAPQSNTTGLPPPGQRIDSGDQRARDADARAILEAELKKAEARPAELLK